MDEPRTCPTDIALPGSSWGDLRWLLVLALVAVGLRAWQVYNTELASRDTILYVRQAWRFEHQGWAQAVRQGPHHPGYCFAIYLASKPVRAWVPDDLPRSMQLAAQLVSSLASVLLVVPMFYLGRELFDSRVALWGTLLFQLLPATGRLLPDGLSEAPFLLLACPALLFVCYGLRTGRWVWFVLAGLLSGLAYLTRTEGLLVVLVGGLVLLALQGSRRWRRSWLVTGRNGVGLGVSCGVVAVPFMLLIGGVSLKDSARYMMDPDKWVKPPKQQAAVPAHAVRAPLPLAVWNFEYNVRPEDRYVWAAYALAKTFNECFFHMLTVPFLLGVWLFRRRGADVPGLWVLFVLWLVLLALLYRLAQSNGYLSERHLALIMLGGVFFAVAGVGVLGGWVARWRPRFSGAGVSVVLLLAVALVCAPKALARMHGNRAGFRQAGEWLAQNTQPGDKVIDPMAWASYHAGREFVGDGDPKSSPPVRYVVLERSGNKHDHLYYLIGPAEELAKQGMAVHRIPMNSKKEKAEVVIYKVEERVAARR